MPVEKHGKRWRVVARWRGFPRIRLVVSSGRGDAVRFERILQELRDAGRLEIMQAVADGRATLQQVSDALRTTTAHRLELSHVIPAPASRTLGELYDRWVEWLKSDSAQNRSGRPYAESTRRRYEDSWDLFFAAVGRVADSSGRHRARFTQDEFDRATAQAVRTTQFNLDDAWERDKLQRILLGRRVLLSQFTTQLVTEFRQARRRDPMVSEATINRDMIALGAFCTWLETQIAEDKDFADCSFTRPRLPKASETTRRKQRHLSRAQLHQVLRHLPAAWRPLFELLVGTGLRITEARNLRVAAVRTETGVIEVVETRLERLKTEASKRVVPIPRNCVSWLATRVRRNHPSQFVFDDRERDYDLAYRAFERACIDAGLHDGGSAHMERYELEKRAAAREGRPTPPPPRTWKKRALFSPHSLRHTFGTDAIAALVPPRDLQGMMGHSNLATTMRYVGDSEDEAKVVAYGEMIGRHQATRLAPRMPQKRGSAASTRRTKSRKSGSTTRKTDRR